MANTPPPRTQDNVGEDALATHDNAEQSPQITKDEYVQYLRDYHPNGDKYLFYTGGAEDQIEAFKARNRGYLYYRDLFEGDDYKQVFSRREVNGEASSVAMGKVAFGDVMLFGGIEYKKFPSSIYTSKEYPEGLQPGFGEQMPNGEQRIKSIKHMTKGATNPSDVMAIEDAQGKLQWQPGHYEGETNSSI